MTAKDAPVFISKTADISNPDLNEVMRLEADEVYRALTTSPNGLTASEAAVRLAHFGSNRIGDEKQPTLLDEIWVRARNPLNGLLLALSLASYVLGDARAAIVIAAMVVLAVVAAFIQEHRSNQAAQKLRSMVHSTAKVLRQPHPEANGFSEVPFDAIVPGDVVSLSAGDMIPADLRLVEAKDLFVNQSTLTGESMPAEKFAHANGSQPTDPIESQNLTFMGANVVSGYATGVVIRTGARTLFGELAKSITRETPQTAFDVGIRRFTWLMIGFITVMVPLVFFINGLTKHNWLEALMFAVAVAVGLTPEMLPMIVTVNLAKGAMAMARRKVIVKRLDAIQNFGAMDVLCTDKTGTLTQDHIILKRHLDIRGEESETVLHYAFLNSKYQSGLRNLLDEAILSHVDLHERFGDESGFSKIDEIPFDFTRRRLSVVVASQDTGHVLICKGAVEEVFAVCTHYRLGDEIGVLDPSHSETAKQETAALNADGFRVIAVACKTLDTPKSAYSVADESGLTLLGYVAFLDPPKDSAREAIALLMSKGIRVKILTGDNALVTRKICHDVGLDVGTIVEGHDLAGLDEKALAAIAETTTVFAKLDPAQKESVVRALRSTGHVVGYMGDGINDSPALKAADVGISVDTAVDIAKESADIILLEKSLLVLHEGAIEGRRIFANILKYIRMGASSNFGNMFSVVGASIFLPFLPMAPVQVLTNNLLYDFSQSAIPTDNVDEDLLASPRRWDIGNVFKFMLVLGPVSSIFDYATFGLMLWIFDAGSNPALFQTGWFVESLLSQTLVIHILRTTKIPFIESRASLALVMTTFTISLCALLLPSSYIGPALGLTPLPWLYWPLIFIVLAAYAILGQLIKRVFVRKWGF
jgi:Mg2+-importing ATPase